MAKSKLRPCKDVDKEYDMLWLWCPGCDEYHAVKVNTPSGWGWNGSQEAPTITPSILVRGTKPISDEEAERILGGEHIEPVPTVCHSFVTDGKIQFLTDSTHALSGQTVDLPEVDM
ncbi:DUF6527 family protein [Desulfosporosinus sp.]|uniref:DUF6527 family protein n=1 Tax=Desulfosporosinus sp. TaxID=157907 RepID=UPI0025BF9291|nr:DUF6527 family protein [Desulfosporosinus sp.]